MTELHDDLAEGDAFLHNDPYLGNTHSADHAILVPVFVDGEHLFTASPRRTRPTAATRCRRPTCPARKDVYEEGALTSRACASSATTRTSTTSSACAGSRSACPTSGTATTSPASARRGSPSAGSRSCARQYGADAIREFIREWFDYSERRMEQAIKQLPSGTLHGGSHARPLPGPAGRHPAQGRGADRRRGGRVEVDLRDNPDNYPGGLNESRACSMANAMIGLFNSIDPDIPHNAGSFRRVTVLLREGCIAGIPKFPHSCSMATTNVADRLVCITQAAFAEIGDGFGLAEGGMGMGPHMAVVAGNDERLGDTPYVNQIFLGSAAGPAARRPTAGRRT